MARMHEPIGVATWREKIADLAEEIGDPGPIIHEFPPGALDVQFDDGFGTSEGPAFTAWTETRVYFPVTYDGAEFVGSAPRNPCAEACEHVGGE